MGPAAAHREDLNHARDGVRSIEHARWAAQDLNVVDVRGREVVERERAAGQIERDAVEQDFDVVALAAAQEQGRLAPERPALDDRGACDILQGFGDGRDPASAQILARDHGRRRGRHRLRDRHFGRRHDDRRECAAVGRRRLGRLGAGDPGWASAPAERAATATHAATATRVRYDVRRTVMSPWDDEQ